MDLSLTEQQELVKSAARDFVQREYPKRVLLDLDDSDTGYTQELWDKAAEMGWLGMLIPQEYGGSGNSITDVAVLFEELGRGPVPGPYFSSAVLGALIVLEAGSEAQKSAILPELAGGRHILTLALTEPGYGWDSEDVQMILEGRNGSYRLSGTKLFVQDALGATHLVCAARTAEAHAGAQGIALAMIDARAPGVSARALPGFNTGLAEVSFDSVEVSETALLGDGHGDAWPALQRALLRAVPVLCAYQVGGSESVFDMSVEYSRTRHQFGRPIGRFQRVQDHIIRIVNHLDAARWTTYEALWKLDTGRPAEASVHMAKAVASDGYLKACDGAHEVHAGVGTDRDYGLTLHTKMSRTLYSFLGDPRRHKRRLGDALDL